MCLPSPNRWPSRYDDAKNEHRLGEDFQLMRAKALTAANSEQYGLGSMGLGMALNLARHLKTVGGPALRYSNRTLEKGKPLEEAGAFPEPDYESVVKASDIVFTMVRVHCRPSSCECRC